MTSINKNSTVVLHFDLRLKDGSVAESTRSIGKALEFEMGKGVFSEKLESQLIGLKAGDKPKIMLLPEDGFGEPHPANVFQVPKDKFKQMEADKPLEEGMIILFSQPSGQEVPGIIRAIDEEEVTVDFNHPLAGQVVLFEFEIVEVKDDA